MLEIRPRELVIFATNFSGLVDWYKNILGFTVTNRVEDGFHYCNLQTQTGIKIGIADSEDMGVVPGDRKNNTVVLQIEVDNVKKLFSYLKEKDVKITGGPSFDEKDKFWFGSFLDLEGNSIWVVDKNCP